MALRVHYIFIRLETFEEILIKRFKKERIYLGDKWLAEQLSTSTCYVRKMLVGEKPIGPKMHDRICMVFKSQPWDALFRVTEAENAGVKE